MGRHQRATTAHDAEREITFLTQDELRRLFAAITSKRERALFLLAYHHGLRAAAASLLQRADVRAKQGRSYLLGAEPSIVSFTP